MICNSCSNQHSQSGRCIVNVKSKAACIKWSRAPGGMTAEQREQYRAAQPKPIQEAITQE